MTSNRQQEIRLLLVDDEDSFRHALFRRLDKRGIKTYQVENGEEAISILSTIPMDVVVMDVKMPGLDGLEALKRIKKKHPEIEVILLTGHSAAQDGVSGIKSGAFDYLSKPIEFEHLLSKIRQAYEKKIRRAEKEQEARCKAQIKEQMITTERLAALGTLAAGVAHEINNPLAIINEAAGYLELLLKRPEMANMPCKREFGNALDKIAKAVKRARGITHQLLGSVRKHEPLLAEESLSRLVDETIQLVRKEAESKQIEIRMEPEAETGPILLDPNQIRQVLLNLLTNAIHATSRGGRITVQLGKGPDDMSLSVIDTGKGIPKENMAKIFEPFFSDKPAGEGTGLGLFVTREIVEKLGGTIEAHSKVGQGTTMKIILPVTKRN